MDYPSHVAATSYGRCLLADQAIAANVPVACFAGPTVQGFDQVPESEVCYAILLEQDRWMIPNTSARYINHSCDPNCIVADNLEVVTVRPVAAGEELTISYNLCRPGDQVPEWDPRWSFRCCCGAARCAGQIAGWQWAE